ncbi:hypothetical protein MAH1_16300 [Sessilibacter sp. MAH1]
MIKLDDKKLKVLLSIFGMLSFAVLEIDNTFCTAETLVNQSFIMIKLEKLFWFVIH